MKYSVTLAALLLAIFATPQIKASTPVEVQIMVEHVYAPIGFDSNDTSQVIVSGWLPNLCHKYPKTSVVIKDKKVFVKLTALRYGQDNPFCPSVAVPFVETVDLGLLDKGKYEVFANQNTPFGQKSELLVSESSSDAIDDHIYANVEYVEADVATKTVKYKGHNPSDCLVLDRIEYVPNGTDTYSVLPVMKQIRDFCPMKMTPFEFETDMPNDLNRDKVLYHVRVMDGKSVNKVVDLKPLDM